MDSARHVVLRGQDSNVTQGGWSWSPCDLESHVLYESRGMQTRLEPAGDGGEALESGLSLNVGLTAGELGDHWCAVSPPWTPGCSSLKAGMETLAV